jgi:hypothetical protein
MDDLSTIRAIWPGEWQDAVFGYALDLLPERSRSRTLLDIHRVTVYEDNSDDGTTWYVRIHTGSASSDGCGIATGSDLADTVRHARATLRAAAEALLGAVSDG